MPSRHESAALPKSFFVVIEGIDGSGKSSVTRQVVQKLGESCRQNVKLTFEPHDPSCAGVYIRQVLTKRLTGVPLRSLALAFAVNRADHCNREIGPFLDAANGNPRVLVCDRYYLSSLVYQTDDAVSFEEVMELNKGARQPDLTVFLSASDRTCYKRMKKRNEEKELFEVHLSKTKAKYASAIDFLRHVRGEQVVEVEAEGTLEEVTDAVLQVLHRHGPSWLNIGSPTLPIDLDCEPFSPSGMTLDEVAKAVYAPLARQRPADPARLQAALERLRMRAAERVRGLGYSSIANLFLDGLRASGYQVLERLSWTDLDAFELSYTMPLGLHQCGAALLLGGTQRYDMIIHKVLSGEKIQTLDRMSDFLFVLDTNPAHLIGRYFERDQIRQAEGNALSPSVSVIGCDNLCRLVLERVLRSFERDHREELEGGPELAAVLAEFRGKWLNESARSGAPDTPSSEGKFA